MPTSKPNKKKNQHDGSTLDDFLREEGILDETEAAALKRALALKVADLMRKQRMKKSTMAKEMRTSRASLDRLLDPCNSSVTLGTLSRAAKALGRKLKIDLIPA
jgi:hypothetical protein